VRRANLPSPVCGRAWIPAVGEPFRAGAGSGPAL